MKKLLRLIAALLAAAVLAVGAYAAYVFISYYRLDDNIDLTVEGAAAARPETGVEYTAASYNMGFGAYSADFGFFMDGGSESRGRSAEEVTANIAGALEALAGTEADIAFIQEVDVKGHRSCNVNEADMIRERFPDESVIFAQNYDSPYLAYPITRPIGSAVSGIMTVAKFEVSSAIRRSLPVQAGPMKIVDLDRCYSVSRTPMENGRELVMYNVHLSAYASDETVIARQLDMLTGDMKGEYDAGNYVICGGDFNCDLLGDSGAIFGVPGNTYTWARPFDSEALPQGLRLVAPIDREDPVASGRNADGPYTPGRTFEITLDGFIVSDNVKVTEARVVDTGFAYSDHQPVYMRFELSEDE
jgi:endonuclease/exonuclease/phosphatase family metal-dependent hydrolase